MAINVVIKCVICVKLLMGFWYYTTAKKTPHLMKMLLTVTYLTCALDCKDTVIINSGTEINGR